MQSKEEYELEGIRWCVRVMLLGLVQVGEDGILVRHLTSRGITEEESDSGSAAEKR